MSQIPTNKEQGRFDNTKYTNQYLLVKIAIIALAISANYLADIHQKMYISAIFISIALLSSIFVFNKTWPFFFGALICYWVAIMKEVWGDVYDYTDITRNLWTIGNVLMGLGFVELLILELLRYFKSKA